MDILQIIKEEHILISKRIQEMLLAKNSVDGLKIFKQLYDDLIFHLQFEKEYLYQEIQLYLKDNSSFLKQSLKNHEQIQALVENINKMLHNSKTITKKCLDTIEELLSIVNEHFKLEEEILMPKIREYISTEDREDLGATFLDLKEEHFKQNVKTHKKLTKEYELSL